MSSAVFDLADRYVDQVCRLSPLTATSLGVGETDQLWDDFGPDGVVAWDELRRRQLEGLEGLPTLSDDDRLAVDVMRRSLESSRLGSEAGDHFRSLRHMASPFHRIRSVFDIMSDADAKQARLATIDQPLGGYRNLLSVGIDEGITVSKRQAQSVVDQAKRLAGPKSSLVDVSDDDQALAQARAAYEEFARWLEDRYLPEASDDDGVGPEVYRRAADPLVGMSFNLEDTYKWGWQEFFRLRDEMAKVARDVVQDGTVEEVKHYLETDHSVTVGSEDQLISFVITTLEDAVESLAGEHFDVPERIRPITAQMAPDDGPTGVYYLRPSEDFSRPGGVWYRPGSQDRFPLYQHRSTAYHEGFPGHHLQIATAMSNSEHLSRFQRTLMWCPGYSEGWAMYAEVLMGELGFLDDPRDYFGMLAKQMYRACRVVVDIGLHLGMKIDPGSPIAPSGPWTFETAVEFMEVYGFRTHEQAHNEVMRYLGWPGQAISYKLGEREILRLRESARKNLGDDFDLKDFHRAVLSTGTVRLDTLAGVVAERLGK